MVKSLYMYELDSELYSTAPRYDKNNEYILKI